MILIIINLNISFFGVIDLIACERQRAWLQKGWFCKAAARISRACMQSRESMRQHCCVPACVYRQACVCVCLFVWKSHVVWGHPCQMVCALWNRVCVTLCSCLSRLELNLCDDAANTVTSRRIYSSIPHKQPAHVRFAQITLRTFCIGTRVGGNVLWSICKTCSISFFFLTQIANQSLLLQRLSAFIHVEVVRTTCCKCYKRHQAASEFMYIRLTGHFMIYFFFLIIQPLFTRQAIKKCSLK